MMQRAGMAMLFALAVGTASAVSFSARGHASASAGLRHLRLVKSFPMKDSVVTGSPDAIRLWLSEPTVPAISKITMASAAGAAVALEALTRDAAKDAPLVAKLTKPVARGSYVVKWKAMSKDGHVVNGTFGFKVQ